MVGHILCNNMITLNCGILPRPLQHSSPPAFNGHVSDVVTKVIDMVTDSAETMLLLGLKNILGRTLNCNT